MTELVNGLDTETIRGYCKLISTHIHKKLVNSFEEICSFLIYGYERGKFMTWNLGFDAQAILKYLPAETLIELYDNNDIEYGEYKVLYIPRKLLKLTHNKHIATIYDLAQYFEKEPLDKVAANYLNDKKHHNIKVMNFKNHQLDWSEERLLSLLQDPELQAYCIQDAILVKNLGDLLLNSIYETLNLHPTSFTSSARLGELKTIDWLIENNDVRQAKYSKATKHHKQWDLKYDQWGDPKMKPNYPYFNPKTLVGKYATIATRGGLFLTMQRGHFNEVTDLDIASAYPNSLRNFPNWSNGDFIEIYSNKDVLNSDYYGWIYAKFNCKWIPFDTNKHEIFVDNIDGIDVNIQVPNKLIVYPTGEREQFITLAEYLFMKQYQFPCNIIHGYIWRHNLDKQQHINPFGWIDNIFILKQKSKKGTMVYLLCKIAMNGAYGKTIQIIGKWKPIYNPFYGSYTTAETRIQVTKFILDNNLESKLINIATDGVLLNGKFNLPSQYLDKSNLGGWSVDHYNEAYVMGNGMLMLLNKDKNGNEQINSRMRGISQNRNLDVRTWMQHRQNISSDIFVPPKLIQSDIERKDLSNEDLGRIIPGKWSGRPLSLAESLIHYKVLKEKFGYERKEGMNIWTKIFRKFNINADRKMHWPENLTFGDILNNTYTGIPLTVTEARNL